MRVATFTDTYMPHRNGVASSLWAIHHTKKPWEEEIFAPRKHNDVKKVFSLPFLLCPEYWLALSVNGMKSKVDSFDIVHNHTPYNMFYYGAKTAKRLGVPLVGTFHTDPAAVFGWLIPTDCPPGKPATKVTWRYLIRLYEHCDRTIAVSPWLADVLRDRGFKGEISVLPNGIDVKKFNPYVDTSEFKKRYNIPKGKDIVLFIGRLQHKKDPKTFVRAALECKEDAVFIIAGEGELKCDLKRMAKKDKRIIFVGYLPEKLLPAAYAAADLLVLPSEMETQALVLIEAMASETACISTNVGIALDVVEAEYIFEHKDYKALAGMMSELLSNKSKREIIAKKGLNLVREEYSLEAMVRKLDKLYGEVLEIPKNDLKSRNWKTLKGIVDRSILNRFE